MEFERLGGRDAGALRDELTGIYRKAWSDTGFFPVAEEVHGFSDRLHRHSSNPDFRLLLARDEDAIVGFAYGYTSVPAGWWRQMVTSGLGVAADKWFEDCFEFAELAVVPEHQRKGAGTLLHDHLLEGLPHRSSVLSTQKENRRACSFYLNRGWTVVDDEFFFPNRLYPYVILGLEL